MPSATDCEACEARHYDPVTARFLSTDPVGFVDSGHDPAYFNRYAYVINDPVNATDPSGKESSFARRLDSRVERYLSGDISKEEYLQEQMAEGYGALAGLTMLPAGRAAQGTYTAGRAAVGGFLLRQGASKSFGGASKFIANTTQGFAKTSGKAGNTTFQSFGKGGRSGGEKLFRTLTNQKGPIDAGKTITGKLKDGSVANIRTRTLQSGGTRTTVEVTRKVTRTGSRIKRTERVKVRFDE